MLVLSTGKETYIVYPFQSLSNIDLHDLFENCDYITPYLHKLLPFHNITDEELQILSKQIFFEIPDSNVAYINPSRVLMQFDCNNKFSTLTINIRSLNKNFFKLEILLRELNFNPSVIIVNETWVTSNRPFLYHLNGYDFINTPSNSRAGGTGVFIKSDINFTVRTDLNLKISNCEDLWVEITLATNNKLIIGSIYRHPSHNFTEFQDRFMCQLEYLSSHNKKYIISGDTNINYFDNSRAVDDYKNEILRHGAIQLVTKSTRFSSNSNSSLLDHVYSNFLENQIITKCITYDISDHLPVLTILQKINKNKKQMQKCLIRDMSKFNPEEFQIELKTQISAIKYESQDVNKQWEQFEKVYSDTVNKHAPNRLQSRRETKRNDKPWLTKGILRSIKVKHKLFKKTLKDPTDAKWKSFKMYRNKLTHTIEASKQIYYKNQIQNNKNQTKKLWEVMNNIVNLKNKKQKNPINISTDSSTLVTDPNKVANLLNKYFSSIGKNLSKALRKIPNLNINPSSDIKSVTDSIFLRPISKIEVLNYIKQLNPKKSVKSNCPPIKFLKLSAEIIAPTLSSLLNKCMEEGVFPNSLKFGEIIPIFKKGDKRKLQNWRPICLLSPFSKIFERHLHNLLIDFINERNLLHPHQYGFRENSSTEQAISQIVEEITNSMQERNVICSVFLDLAKAFDTIDHKILLDKLYKYGIRGLPAKLISNYLTNRYQVTKTNHEISSPEPVTCGVPQGSILGPLLFILYINDLPLCSKFSIRLFADDACLTVHKRNSDELENITNQELVKINNWMNANRLTVNYTKTNYIIFTRSNIQKQFTITMDTNKLERVENTRYLGVQLDQKLNWNSHLKTLKSKLNSASYILSKLRHYLDVPSLKMVYYSLVYPSLNYCVTNWGGSPKTTLKPIVTTQKKILRFITHNSYDSHTNPIFLHHKILPFTQIYQLNLATLMHKIKNNAITGSYHLIPLNQQHSQNTRLSKSGNYFQQFQKNIVWQINLLHFSSETLAYCSGGNKNTAPVFI